MNFSLFRKPSRYIDHEVNSVKKDSATLRMALCFPDVYDIGMSHLGLKILYGIINAIPYASAERFFSPWPDLAEYLKKEKLPLSSLETNTPLSSFDVVGFTLQYELSYTTVLNMLDLGGIPIRSDERSDRHPLILAGGPCTVNPGPMLPFFDAFLIGDGEDATGEIVETCYRYKIEGDGRREGLLRALASIDGLFVPGYSRTPVRKRIIENLDTAFYPVAPLVPYTQVVHDRISIEISRGCTCGCRFCQAGMTYRPVRERSPEKVIELAEASLANTGYDEVSLSSLSAGDYCQLLPLAKALNRKFHGRTVTLSLPSLRVSALNDELIKEIRHVRKTGFTIAPEAATARLRYVINKDFNDDDYERALHSVFKAGWLGLKLYFMIGLPTERDEDVEAIPAMVHKALKTARKYAKRFTGVNVGVSPFVPKPHTPFQWCGQMPFDEIKRKSRYLKNALDGKSMKYKGHDERMSLLEAMLSRGDAELALLIESAWRKGAMLDAWTEWFDYTRWMEAMEKTGMDGPALAQRSFRTDAPLPWDYIDTTVDKAYLIQEYESALEERKTPDCRESCNACGTGCAAGQYLACEPRLIVSERPLPPVRHIYSPARVRLVYGKTDRLRHLSHLELMAALLKGFRRAELPLMYSKGFHPTPGVSFGPALAVGIAGEKEYLDMEVQPPFDVERYREKLAAALPPGLPVIKMFFINKDLPSLSRFISAYRYEMAVEQKVDKAYLEERLNDPENKWLLPIIINFDIINGVCVLMVKDTKERAVKPSQVVEALLERNIEAMDVRRTAMYGWNKGWVEPDDVKGMRCERDEARGR